MLSELIINVTFSETRIALLENGTLVEFFIERKNEKGIIGNIYKGKVTKVLPGMDAAFVDIGLERPSFLYVKDVVIDPGTYEEFEDTSYVADQKDRIEGVLEEGQELMVQVSRGPFGNKGTRVTSKITLPGRLLVLMPASTHIGVSRRIQNESEKKRLYQLLKEICPRGFGLIARTASEGKSKEDLEEDLNFLMRIWKGVVEKAEKVHAPKLLYEDMGLVFRVIRDLYGHNLRKIVIDDLSLYTAVKDFLKSYLPDLECEVIPYDGDEPVFEAMGIEMEIGKIKQKRVYLKSGGYIVFDYTEALTVIDVNTGKYLGKKDLEDTILRTNLEAAKEIAYQIRLRNIGGIIVIDFIDMERKESRELVFNTLCEALKKDRIKTTVYPISEIGLVQLTRKRTGNDVIGMLLDPCPHCEGAGFVNSAHSVCYSLLRELKYFCKRRDAKSLNVYLSFELANLVYEEEKEAIEFLESKYGKKINVYTRPDLAFDDYRIEIVV
ncbi:MAG: Rne/Rng family ribonuclease [Desulfobacterota bacterium]|nr:Rne/Rng family ribonuclease [Thermodesulfobacteriota bacterium]MDW8002121.1 Rne/Rng family ribonuclease [Deltaproteobacteria bacterium]